MEPKDHEIMRTRYSTEV